MLDPVDMRLGINGLFLRIPQSLGHSPDGSIYPFRNCVWLTQCRDTFA